MKKNKKNLTGKKFGKLTVIGIDRNCNTDNRLKRRWMVECECGNKYSILEQYLIYKKTTNDCPNCSSIKRRAKNTISSMLWHNIQKRSIYDNIEISPLITKEFLWNLYIKQNKKCALSGKDIYIVSSTRDEKENTASLDRIDSSKGYFVDNVQWIHKIINRMKLSFNEKYFIELCGLIAKNN